MTAPKDYEKEALIAQLLAHLSTKPMYFISAFNIMINAMIRYRNGEPDMDPVVLSVMRQHHFQELMRLGFPGD